MSVDFVMNRNGNSTGTIFPTPIFLFSFFFVCTHLTPKKEKFLVTEHWNWMWFMFPKLFLIKMTRKNQTNSILVGKKKIDSRVYCYWTDSVEWAKSLNLHTNFTRYCMFFLWLNHWFRLWFNQIQSNQIHYLRDGMNFWHL